MALKAGRVGVRPDQVDRYGRIKINTVLNELYDNVPFLKYKWHEIHVSSDGTTYSVETDIENITVAYNAVRFTAGQKIKGVMYLVHTLKLNDGENALTVPTSGYARLSYAQDALNIPAANQRFDLTIWVALSDSEIVTLSKSIGNDETVEKTKKSSKKTL